MNNQNKKQYTNNDKEKEKESRLMILDNTAPTESDLDVLYATRLDSTNQEDVGKKLSALKHLLEKDLKAADLKWSLFIAACNTYRYDTCLKPFPAMYIKNECKDIEALVKFLKYCVIHIAFVCNNLRTYQTLKFDLQRKAIELIPPLAIILKALQEPDVYEKYGKTVDLLYWVLIRLRDPYIKSVNKECVSFFIAKSCMNFKNFTI